LAHIAGVLPKFPSPPIVSSSLTKILTPGMCERESEWEIGRGKEGEREGEGGRERERELPGAEMKSHKLTLCKSTLKKSF
jgi:hypothetical protein